MTRDDFKRTIRALRNEYVPSRIATATASADMVREHDPELARLFMQTAATQGALLEYLRKRTEG